MYIYISLSEHFMTDSLSSREHATTEPAANAIFIFDLALSLCLFKKSSSKLVCIYSIHHSSEIEIWEKCRLDD